MNFDKPVTHKSATTKAVDAANLGDQVIDSATPEGRPRGRGSRTELATQPPEIYSQTESSPRGQVGSVIAAIETDIIRSRILPGMRLIEDHLMEDYGAKRHVVRAALVELQRLGIVVKPPHRGAELRRFDGAELRDLYAMREVLHRAAIRAIVRPLPEGQFARVERALAAHAAAAGSGDLIAIHRTNMAFHQELYGLCGNAYLANSIRLHEWLSFPVRAYGVADAEALRQACEEHQAMVDALHAGDLETLERLAVGHMDRACRIYAKKFLLDVVSEG
jgi:DNA-binding GntR family transcriptional regulator